MSSKRDGGMLFAMSDSSLDMKSDKSTKGVPMVECEPLPKQKEALRAWIDVTFDGAGVPAALGSHPACIGRILQHRANANHPITAVQWAIVGGQTLANYQVAIAQSTETAVTANDLQANPLRFAWRTTGNYSVTCQVTTTAGVAVVTNQYAITGPTVDACIAATGAVDVYGGNMLRFHSHGMVNHGIEITADVTGHPTVAGELRWLQIIRTSRHALNTAGQHQSMNSNGEARIDNGNHPLICFYQNRNVNVAANAQVQIDLNDSPGMGLNHVHVTMVNIGGVGRESFSSYLVFRPAGNDTLWVAIRQVNWWWYGTAMYEHGAWALCDPVNWSHDPPDQAPDGQPSWVGDVNSAHF